jgi:hypothetical protein
LDIFAHYNLPYREITNITSIKNITNIRNIKNIIRITNVASERLLVISERMFPDDSAADVADSGFGYRVYDGCVFFGVLFQYSP